MALGKGGDSPGFSMWRVPLRWGRWRRGWSGEETEFVRDVFELLIVCTRGCVRLRVALRVSLGELSWQMVQI